MVRTWLTTPSNPQRKGSYVAIKSVQLYKLTKKLKENLLSEIKILRSLHHPHIVALIDCQEGSSHMHLVMEFCELGDLSQFIKKRSSLGSHEATAAMIKKYPNPLIGGLNEVVVRHFLKQIASALEFLRAKNYVHRDIKPQNLLLIPSPRWYAERGQEVRPFTVDDNSLVPAAGIDTLPMLKVADFGFARVLPQTSLAETLCGSPLYMAPEILRYEKYDAKADLWSLGTVLHEMMVGKPPFRANNHVELLRKIEKQDDKIKFPEGLVISDGMKKLIRALLKKAPTERMGYESFFQNDVVRDEIPDLVGEDRPPEPENGPAVFNERVQSSTEIEIRSSKEETRRRSDSGRAPTSMSTTPPAGPIKRTPSNAQISQTPPRPSSREGRFSNTPLTMAERQNSGQRERRPPITSYATAPARQLQLQDRAPAAATLAMQQRNNRASPSPNSSVLREHLERERAPQRPDDRALREARERVAQDIAFERDYVLVEKRAVEVNAFADELAASPQLQRGYQDNPASPRGGAMVRRTTTQGAPASTSGAQVTPSRAIQIATIRQRPEQQRTSSYERRYGPNPTSATSAISKALNMANIRLFGLGFSPPTGNGPSPPQGYTAFPMYPTAQGNVLMIGDGGKSLGKDEDSRAVILAEELATRSDVVYGFAEVKYKQLLPITPSNDQRLGLGLAGKASSNTDSAEDEDLTVDAVVAIAEEALVLYVKALAILTRSIDVAGTWWGQKNRGEVVGESASPRAHSPRTGLAAIGTRMSNVVQWARNRFNECLEKSEYVGRKLIEAQKNLPLDHPGHPSNHPSASSSATSIGTSAENITLTSGVTAEKLMYDRAVEMSRAAAVNELVNMDLAGCEISYGTAIRMLEAILEDDNAPSGRKDGDGRKGVKPEDETINGLDSADRQTVMKRKSS